MKVQPLFDIFAAFLSIGLFFATLWMWYGFVRTQTLAVPFETEISPANNESIQPLPSLKSFESSKKFKTEPTSTSVSVVTNTTSVKLNPNHENTTRTPRVATSLLTGSLVLNDTDVHLNVPFTSQAPEKIWDDPWQNACEEAAILMLDAYYKGYGLSPLSAKDELQRIITWEEQQGWGASITIEQVKKIATDYFKSTKKITIVENPTVEQIKKFVAAGSPVLVVADGKVLPNKYYSRGGPTYHAFIIRGYTKDQFITNDPGVNRGANFVFRLLQLCMLCMIGMMGMYSTEKKQF